MYAQDSEISANVDIAINIALDLKRRWLFAEENKKRIRAGLLPINIAVGIHAGLTQLTPGEESVDNPGGWQPEGYAINLAKRVESHSRQGRSTNIFVSEAAFGQWNSLSDERTYLFDEPKIISPKGISTDIRVYELKHHFLPSDWRETSGPSERAKHFLDPTIVDIKILDAAVDINPTNLWLSEEFIRSSMLVAFNKLTEKQRKNDKSLYRAFRPALKRAELLAQSEQRDAGVLCIQGLIEGELGHYNAERERYEQAIKAPESLPEAYWYKGLSYSEEVFEALGYRTDIEKSDLTDDLLKLVEAAIDCYTQAKMARFQSAWVRYDLGCELVRWAANEKELSDGIDEIVMACRRLPDIGARIEGEPYLKSVQTNTSIIKCKKDAS